MSISSFINRVQIVALDTIRQWWRPITCIGIAGAMIMNGIVLPIITSEYPDLTGLSALVASAAAAFAVREWGKTKGSG